MPHSGIPGSTPACGSPRLIAANHALHRFLAPRHPPCALSSLTIKPLPTNGLQVEGQGSVQEPWRSRPPVGPTRPTKGILPPRRFKIRACDAIVLQRSRQHSLFSFQSPRSIAARGGNYSDFPTRVNYLASPRRPELFWWRKWDSNPRPSACKADALPAELFPQIFRGLRLIRGGPGKI